VSAVAERVGRMNDARRKHGMVIRRIPDPETGELITYLPSVQLAQLFGVNRDTVNRWAAHGIVRSPGVLASHRHCSVADAYRYCSLTMSQRRDEYRHRYTTEAERRAMIEFEQKAQAATLPRARHRGERYDEYDLTFIVTMVEEGHTAEIIAKALGRTYHGVCGAIERLRREGELPPVPKTDDWREDALELLTAEERAKLR